MAYHIELLERDQNFLATCSDIPAAARFALLERCEQGLANISDVARCDPTDRIASDRFRYLYLFRGKDGLGRTLRFIVDESRRAYNVLRVLYVDVVEGKPLRRLEPPTTEAG